MYNKCSKNNHLLKNQNTTSEIILPGCASKTLQSFFPSSHNVNEWLGAVVGAKQIILALRWILFAEWVYCG